MDSFLWITIWFADIISAFALLPNKETLVSKSLLFVRICGENMSKNKVEKWEFKKALLIYFDRIMNGGLIFVVHYTWRLNGTIFDTFKKQDREKKVGFACLSDFFGFYK